MYQSPEVKDHIDTSSTVKSRALILAEWNLNISENIEKIGNYRYRPVANQDFAQKDIAEDYDRLDVANDYTGATDSDTVIDGVYDSNDEPIAFSSVDKKMGMLFSLEQCFDRFRPRSGINKMIFDETLYVNDASTSFATRPRYYMASRDDAFKYWTSVRQEQSKMTGISYLSDSKNYINDACPFIVYKNIVPANKIVVKVQTNVGTEELDGLKDMDGKDIDDPFYGQSNMTVPKVWEIQYLDENDAWQTAKSFTTNVFSTDGYAEVQYGLTIPAGYSYENFIKARTVNSTEFLPDTAPDGYAYLLIENTGDIGKYFVANSSNTTGDAYLGKDYPGWDIWTPEYSWYVGSQTADIHTSIVTNLTDLDSYVVDGKTLYREFSEIRGLRIVTEQMNIQNSHLDLIELSPRLSADLSYMTTSYSATREAADLSSSPLPIGSLLASTGSLELFDYDIAFSKNNKRSILNVVKDDEIVYNISTKNIQVKIFEVVELNDLDYYIPIKTFYAEGFPETDAYERTVSIALRDMFFYFESKTPQDMVVVDQPISYVIATLLDNIGFSNYRFVRLPNETEDVIPFFFVSKESNVAQVLNELAQATQSAIFFDEDNNLIIASRGYMFPNSGERDTDINLVASADSRKSGAYKNERTKTIISNVKNIASQDEPIYNDGKVSYSEKYIQKTIKNIAQASKLDKDRNWVYNPVLLWEISESDTVKSINGERDGNGGYALTAIPLKTDLTDSVPEVALVNGVPKIINNTISFGDSVYWVGRYNGYFYANGEVIKYDAVEYAVPQKAYTGFGGTLSSTNTLTLTAGTVSNLHVGDRVYKVSGDGDFGTGAAITSIVTNSETDVTTLTLDASHKTVDDIVFTTTGTPTVWISNIDQYESYFAKIPFNGKMYPTGNIRIFAEAAYDADDNLIIGPVAKHGRGQFGTTITYHAAGIDSSWTNVNNHGGCYMSMDTLLNGGKQKLAPAGKITTATSEAPFTAKIENMRSRAGFYVGQEIFASKAVTLASKGTIANAAGSASPWTATLKDLVSTDNFYVNQAIEATAGTGTLTSGRVVEITSKTSIKLSSTAQAFGNGTVVDIRPRDDVGDLGAGIVKVKSVDSQTVTSGQDPMYTVTLTSTDVMTNGDIYGIYAKELPIGGYKVCGNTSESRNVAAKTKFSGLMKNYLAGDTLSESVKVDPIASSQMVQSSALVINGPSFNSDSNPVDYISYTTKKMNDAYKFFGTRMRIVGQSGVDDVRLQTPVGASGWTTIDGKLVAGSSGGMAVLMNPTTNIGYYFEIAALTDNNVTNYTGETNPVNNVFFYKLRSKYDYYITEKPLGYKIENGVMTPDPVNTDRLNIVGDDAREQVGQVILFDTGDDALDGTWRIDSLSDPWKLTKIPNIAYPETLFAGATSIITDAGQFSGSGRMVGDANPTVYDLAVEYEDIGGKRNFYLYINNLCIGYVEDSTPTTAYDNVALFTRGSARVMFENFYALTNSYMSNTGAALSAPIANVFKDDGSISQSESFKKYALSGAIQSTYLSGIGSQEPPKYNMFYDEFGTIMRECAYFNIKYDKAYPALRAMLAPTFNTEKGYTVSGFYDNPYGAEFLIFNNTDTVLALDESTGNYLRILGVTFTQSSENDVTVDEYFSEKGNLSNSELVSSTNLSKNKKVFQDIKNSRTTYGKKEFSFTSPYIQSKEAAEKILGWTIEKINRPRKAIGLSIFANPLIQLGDIVEIEYFDNDGTDILGTDGSQFVVYSIEYQKQSSGPSMTLHLSEVG